SRTHLVAWTVDTRSRSPRSPTGAEHRAKNSRLTPGAPRVPVRTVGPVTIMMQVTRRIFPEVIAERADERASRSGAKHSGDAPLRRSCGSLMRCQHITRV